MRYLFVVHRYPPNFIGGSEKNVQRMAEALALKGVDVTVLSDEHSGDYRNVKVTSDRNILKTPFDLIVVHGSCPTQDHVLINSEEISKISPILYLLIQPSDHPIVQLGMRHAKYIGCGTSFDMEHAKKYGHLDKVRWITYGVNAEQMGVSGRFKDYYGITTKEMFLAVGGFWPHKRHIELAEAFRAVNRPDCTLVLMGYDIRYGRPPMQSANVKVIIGAPDSDVADAMADADLLIQNSDSEGYGLTIIEGMLNGAPWASTPVALAHDIRDKGIIFNNDAELREVLKSFIPISKEDKYRKLIYADINYNILHATEQLIRILDT